MKNLALLGAGNWGINYLNTLNSLEALAAVYDTDEARLAKLRELYPEILFTSNLEEILAAPEIKGAVIASPAMTHYEMAKAALLAGKDVLVEKPMTVKMSESEELVKLAREKQRVLMVGHLLLHSKGVRRLKELIKQGELGDILYIHSHRLSTGKIRREEDVIWSFAPHDLSVVLYLAGENPASADVQALSVVQPGIPDLANLSLIFPNRIKAMITVNWISPVKDRGVWVVGSRKMAVYDEIKNQITVFDQQINPETLEISKGENLVISFESDMPLTTQCRAFIEGMEKRLTPEEVSGEKGLEITRILCNLEHKFIQEVENAKLYCA